MTYIDKVKHILDNYNFCTYQEDIRFGDVDIANPSTYFWRLFTQHFYQIPHTNSIFHDKELFNFLRNYDYKDEFDLKTCLERDKKFILQMDLHPATSHNKPFELIKTKFFDYLFSKKEIIESMKSGKMTLFLYQGWEAENYTISWWPDDKYKTFYHMIEDVLQEYGLSYSSIVVLNSNVKLYNHKHNVNIIYDNAMEMNSFKRGVSGTEYGIKIKDFDETYSVDDYLDKVKNSKYRLLRISRTPQHLRDKMLYFLYKSNFHNKSVIEHRYYDKNNIIDDSKFFQKAKKYCKQNNLIELIDLFDYDKIDKNILNNIDKDIPLMGSPYEKKQGYHKLHLHPNSPIPFDVYENTIFTWASTSLPDQDDKVFLNQSTFNPILNYHPVIWHGQKHTTKWFKYFGFKSYEWLFENETKADDTDCIAERFVLNMQDVIRVMNMSDDELYNRIKDNKDTLQHNRDLLFECKSIERIITKFYETTI
ncbi:MAG: hypothetical protein CBD63_02990 [Candidatus Pelagibacter sp. TMED203]|nr:MAG: hypothetical protein CBD63_02990 [Candidatus Pelagibacter sp. TMED203]|tara:strand:- start:101 stop:1531 length:1431 start_codon:yes stop_codon:yes gene_type:complete